MADRYFTPEDVEALIPTLTGLVEGLRAANQEAQAARARMQAEQQRLTLAGGGVPDPQGRADRTRLETASAAMKTAVERIHELGGVPKDLEMGLVDFPGLRDGRVVNLCWKHGERKVRWWHGLDEGFAARKPL